MTDSEPDDGVPLALIANVRSRWREVLRGEISDEQAVLGDWNLAARDIDPARVAVLFGSVQAAIVRAWRVTDPQPVPGYSPPRIRFAALDRLHHLEGLPSPYSWRRGEMYPVVAIPVDQLDLDLTPPAPVELGATGAARIGGYVLRVDGQTARITVPAGRQLTVVTLMGESGADADTDPS
ncbi:MAG: hypothetical protein ABJB33_05850 [Gemmatimonadota bacterium]